MKRIFGFVFVLAILIFVPYSLKAQETPAADTSFSPELVWQIYLLKNPKAEDVSNLLDDLKIGEAYKALAAEWLLSHDDFLRGPYGEYTLRSIIYFSPEPYKQKAWEQLKLSEDDVEIVILLVSDRGSVPERYKNAAAEELLKRSSSRDDLYSIMVAAPRDGDRELAAERLIAEGSESSLAWIVVRAPREDQKSRAWKKFIELLPEVIVKEHTRHIFSSMRGNIRYIADSATEPYRTEAQFLLNLLNADPGQSLELMHQKP
ncbi:MAG: hypothetical protein Q7S09_03315 [bacterium]|nr:hypothetical protein [bacterium]